MPRSSSSPLMSTSTASPWGAPPHTIDDGIAPRTVNETRVAPTAPPMRPRIVRTLSGPREPDATAIDASAVTCRISVSRLVVATWGAPRDGCCIHRHLVREPVARRRRRLCPAGGGDAIERDVVGCLGGRY